jgi:hypothetical protein
MPFFQNVFTNDFIGTWVLADRQHSPDFNCGRNYGRGDEVVIVHAKESYNLSGNDADGVAKALLTLSFAMNDPNTWVDLAITISAASLAAVKASEIKTSLDANATFADFFATTLEVFEDDKTPRLMIRQRKPVTQFRFYIKNTGAETILKFNKFAGVAELPSYFARHTIANKATYPDGIGHLIQLGTTGVDANVITNAVDNKGISRNYTASAQADYLLLRGKSGLFMHYKYTIDGSNRITQIIEYPAGALAGDLAKKTTMSYTAANTNPTLKAEVPYALQSADLITPP